MVIPWDTDFKLFERKIEKVTGGLELEPNKKGAVVFRAKASVIIYRERSSACVIRASRVTGTKLAKM